MLDHVERRRFLVQPAGKHPPQLPVGALDVELHERSGQFLIFPRSRRLARPQPHHRIPDPDRLSRPQRDVADDPVALVEEAEHRDPLRHRSHSGLAGRSQRHVVGDRGFIALARPVAAVAGACRHRQQQDRR
jgi:hypothetical protein